MFFYLDTELFYAKVFWPFSCKNNNFIIFSFMKRAYDFTFFPQLMAGHKANCYISGDKSALRQPHAHRFLRLCFLHQPDRHDVPDHRWYHRAQLSSQGDTNSDSSVVAHS